MDKSAVQKATQNFMFRFVVQGCVIFVTLVGIPVGGFISHRVVKTLDDISTKQDIARDEVNRINQALIRIEGDSRVINGRIETLNGRIDTLGRDFTSRVDAISAWTRKNADEIDKVKDWFYRPQQAK